MRAKPLKLESLNTQYYGNAHSFKHISEYFSGKENSSYRPIVRSTPAEHVGLYFIIKLSQSMSSLPEGAQAQLTYIGTSSPDKKTHVFTLPSKGSSELYIGLTGADWPDPSQRIVAWTLTFLDSAGSVMLQSHSFLSTCD